MAIALYNGMNNTMKNKIVNWDCLDNGLFNTSYAIHIGLTLTYFSCDYKGDIVLIRELDY